MKTFKTPDEAIHHSIKYDAITFCENTEENMDELKLLSDDWTESNEGYEFWSEFSKRKDGDMAWRVHVII